MSRITWFPPTVSRVIGTAREVGPGTFSGMLSFVATTMPSATAIASAFSA
jgi:hypothetical protein